MTLLVIIVTLAGLASFVGCVVLLNAVWWG